MGRHQLRIEILVSGRGVEAAAKRAFSKWTSRLEGRKRTIIGSLVMLVSSVSRWWCGRPHRGSLAGSSASRSRRRDGRRLWSADRRARQAPNAARGASLLATLLMVCLAARGPTFVALPGCSGSRSSSRRACRGGFDAMTCAVWTRAALCESVCCRCRGLLAARAPRSLGNNSDV